MRIIGIFNRQKRCYYLFQVQLDYFLKIISKKTNFFYYVYHRTVHTGNLGRSTLF